MLRNRAVLTAAVALITFFVSARALFELPSLPDTDSYYHLAVAQLYAEQGFVDKLEWARFSAMHDGFGDKDLLFHLLLIPFTRGDAATGGRLAIALWNALIAGAITWIAIEAVGPWGALLAPLLFLTAPYFWIRTIRLRPELLSLLFFLLIAWATARRKVWTVTLLSMALTLGHTAFHVLAAMAVLWLLATREWKPTIATFAGILAGILLHPHFPDNLRIWYLQNVRFLQLKNVLDVGAEIHAPRLQHLLLNNAGWWLAVAAALLLAPPLIRLRHLLPASGAKATQFDAAQDSVTFSPPRGEKVPKADEGWRPRATVVFLSTAAVFLVLQLMMERMSTYFFPFAMLAVTFACAGTVRRPVVAAILVVVAVTASTPFALRTMRFLSERLPPDVERDYAEFAAHVPAGAKVAARWGATDAYVFFAPQGRYLNVLDPVFMAVPHPREYWAQRRMFDGSEPDIATITKNVLDSDYIAFAKWEATPLFLERVKNDPRLERVYDGYNVLLRVRTDP